MVDDFLATFGEEVYNNAPPVFFADMKEDDASAVNTGAVSTYTDLYAGDPYASLPLGMVPQAMAFVNSPDGQQSFARAIIGSVERSELGFSSPMINLVKEAAARLGRKASTRTMLLNRTGAKIVRMALDGLKARAEGTKVPAMMNPGF